MSEEKYYIPITVHRYPFDDTLSYETSDQYLQFVFATLDKGIIKEIIKKKLMETNVAETIKMIDKINEKVSWARASVELYDINVFLSKEEFIQLISETIKVLRARANFLEEYKEYVSKVMNK